MFCIVAKNQEEGIGIKRGTSLTLTLLIAFVLGLTGCNNTSEKVNSVDQPESTINQASESPVSDFEYTVNDDGGITINKYIGKAVDVVIPEKIDGKNITAIATAAFWRNDEIVTVTMPDTVTTIENTAFEQCSSLVKVSLSQNLSSIENTVFKDCKNLCSFYIQFR